MEIWKFWKRISVDKIQCCGGGYIFYLTTCTLSVTLVTLIATSENFVLVSGPYEFFLFVTIPYAPTPPLLFSQLFLDICEFPKKIPSGIIKNNILLNHVVIWVSFDLIIEARYVSQCVGYHTLTKIFVCGTLEFSKIAH